MGGTFIDKAPFHAERHECAQYFSPQLAESHLTRSLLRQIVTRIRRVATGNDERGRSRALFGRGLKRPAEHQSAG